jgi:hypothetical protein
MRRYHCSISADVHFSIAADDVHEAKRKLEKVVKELDTTQLELSDGAFDGRIIIKKHSDLMSDEGLIPEGTASSF